MIFKQNKNTGKDLRSLAAANIRQRKELSQVADRIEWFTANGIPGNSKGKNGDLAIDNSGTIYKKESGRWL